jgi:hypothetical protein
MTYNGPYPLILLKTITVNSSTASMDFSQFSSRFNNYLLVFSKMLPVTSGANLQMLVNTGGGFITSNYQSGVQRSAYNSATINNTNSTSAMLLTGPLGTTTSGAGYINLMNVTNGSQVTINGNFTSFDTALGTTAFGPFGGNNTAANITQIRFQMNTGNILQGLVSLYGVLG